MSQIFKFNELELPVDMSDADFVEAYENALDTLGEAEKNLMKTGKTSGIIRQYCQVFRTFFDDIYGEGTAEMLYGDKYNARLCEDSYDAFLSCCLKDKEESETHRMQIVGKYNGNREQRRAAAKKPYVYKG